MPIEKFMGLVFIYIVLNIILFAIYKLTEKHKIVHRIISTIDNLLFCGLAGYGLYQANPYFVILLPCIILIVYPISWGLNRELSDEDVASMVYLRSLVPIKSEDSMKIKLAFAHFITFPFYYLLDSWQKDFKL